MCPFRKPIFFLVHEQEEEKMKRKTDEQMNAMPKPAWKIGGILDPRKRHAKPPGKHIFHPKHHRVVPLSLFFPYPHISLNTPLTFHPPNNHSSPCRPHLVTVPDVLGSLFLSFPHSVDVDVAVVEDEERMWCRRELEEAGAMDGREICTCETAAGAVWLRAGFMLANRFVVGDEGGEDAELGVEGAVEEGVEALEVLRAGGWRDAGERGWVA